MDAGISADATDVTARRLCKFAFCENRGVARVGSCFARARARVSESLADTAGLASKVRS
jgi:hypothetical protein